MSGHESRIGKFEGGDILIGTLAYPQFATPCLICEEEIIVYSMGHSPRICEKCKSAVMKMREQEELNVSRNT